MNRSTLSAFVDQHIALCRHSSRTHPDDIERDFLQSNYWRGLLCDFIQFWSSRGGPWPITSALALDWISEGTDPKNPYKARQRLKGLRRFLKFLRGTEPATQVPENLVGRHPRRIPRLLSIQEIRRLMKAPEQLRLCQPFHGLTLTTLLGLLACTGMRIGEALRLKICDAHLDANPPFIAIYETKFGKSRIVVLHTSVADRLRAYAKTRKTVLGTRSAEAFFVRQTGKPLRYNTTLITFRRLLHHAGITDTTGAKIALHTLRHSFVVRRLTLWHRTGKNVAELLPHLSVYLGHLSPANTYWYLTATPELLESASARFESPEKGAPR
jgi:integrase/recombinase XerD